LFVDCFFNAYNAVVVVGNTFLSSLVLTAADFLWIGRKQLQTVDKPEEKIKLARSIIPLISKITSETQTSILKPAFSTITTFVQPTVNPTCYDFKALNMGVWRQIAEYLYLKKRDPNQPRTQWMKYMHGMNRLSIIIFLIAIVIMLFRLVIIPLFR
jgi:hypothetical protein